MPKLDTTQEELKGIFWYNPATGDLLWRHHILIQKRRRGKPAAKKFDCYTYLAVNVSGQSVPAHHIIWCMQTGDWPSSRIYHINGDRTDNRWANLSAQDPASGAAANTRNRQPSQATVDAPEIPLPALGGPSW